MQTEDTSATNDTTTGLWDVVSDPSDSLGDIDVIDRADETGGSVVDPDGTTPTADDSAGTGVYDPEVTGTNDLGDLQDALGDLGNWARNIGPDWLDEAAIVLIVLALLIALRPYASLGANATG